MFSKMIEVNNWIGERMSGRQVEPARSGMPADGTIVYSGGQVTDQFILGTLETKVYGGQAASAALALNRMAAAPEPARRTSSDRSRSLDDRLRALGVRVADR
jgi:hypothetical protein